MTRTAAAFVLLSAVAGQALTESPPYYIGEILPTPKRATYKDDFIPVFDMSTRKPLVVVLVGPERAARLAGRDFIARVCALAGLEEPNFAPRTHDGNLPPGNVVWLGSTPPRAVAAVFGSQPELTTSPAWRSEQGYVIRTVTGGHRTLCLARGGGAMGTYFAAMSLVQLLKVDGDRVLLRAVTVEDWPTFKMRGTCCYDPEAAAWLALAKFSTLDCNYGSVGVDGWRDPDGRELPGWGRYSGAGSLAVMPDTDNPHSGKRCVAATIASYYEELNGKPNYLSAALTLGDTNGYTGPDALPATPGTYHLSVWMRGNVPKVAVSVTGWTTGQATSADRTTIPVTPASIEPTTRWHRYPFTFTLPPGVHTFSPQFRLLGFKAEGYDLGAGFWVDDAVLTREGSPKNLAPNGDAEQAGHAYRDKIAALWDWAVPRGLWPVQYVNPLHVTGWEDDGNLKIQVSDPEQIDDLADTFRLSLNRGGTWVMLALDDFSSRLGGPAPYYIITNEADRKAFKSLGECHGTLVRELYKRLQQTHPRCRMIVCPAYYWNPKGAYQKEGEKYLREFGRLVPKDVLIVWTGPNVRSRTITRENVSYFTNLIGRKPYLWDNTIYARHAKPTYVLDPFDSRYPDGFWERLSGGLHNNGGATGLYEVGCLVYGDYAWNPEAYDPPKSLDKALGMVLGEGCAAAAKAFRDHYFAVRDPHYALTRNLAGKTVEQLVEVVGPLSKTDIDEIAAHVKAMDTALAALRAKSPNKPLLGALAELAAPLRESAQILKGQGDLTVHAVQRIAGGIRLRDWAFIGGVGHRVYANRCEPKRATWVYGRRTRTHTLTASFMLTDPPTGATLVLVGQNTDKGGRTKVDITLNGHRLYRGPNKCRSHGWSEWPVNVPPGWLKQGANRLTIANLEDSDSTNAAWFMLAEAKLLWR